MTSRVKSPAEPVTQFFCEYPGPVAQLAVRLRRLIRESIPGAREELDRAGRVVGYSFGSGYAGLVCTIIMSRTGTKLGLVGSAELADPNQLLEGTGKRHRYISFTQASDFDRAGIGDILHAAQKRREERSRNQGLTRRCS